MHGQIDEKTPIDGEKASTKRKTKVQLTYHALLCFTFGPRALFTNHTYMHTRTSPLHSPFPVPQLRLAISMWPPPECTVLNSSSRSLADMYRPAWPWGGAQGQGVGSIRS